MFNLDDNGLILLNRSVQLKPYVARTPKQFELMTDEEIREGAGGTLIADTESYENYFVAAFKCIKTGKIIRFEIDPEKDIWFNNFKLSWIMHNYRVVGFNILKYDLAMIWLAYKNQNTEILQNLSRKIIYQEAKLSDLRKEFDFKIHETNIIDTIEVCPLKGSLKLYGARIHSPRIQDVPFSVHKPITEKEKEIVADYNINDLDETQRLFEFMHDRFELREALSIEYKTDLRSKSDAQIAEAVISREVYKLTKQWPKRIIVEPGTTFNYNIPSYITYQTPILQQMLEQVRQAKFIVHEYGSVSMPSELKDISLNKSIYRMGIGGLHSYEKNVSYKSTDTISIVDRDIASFYPRIILNQRLYPEHMGEAFLQVYESIVERRLVAKKIGNKTADKGLKVTINGTFGKTGNVWSVLYSPHLMIQITITGQLTLLMLIEAVEMTGIEVISANTDGIVMLCPQHLEGALANVIGQWEQWTGFQTEETRYASYYARDVNAYFAVKTDGTVKIKGPYSEVGSTTGTSLDNNPASLICSDAIALLLGKGVPIEKTIQECKDIRRFVTVRNVKGGAHKDQNYLGKVIRWYYAKNSPGTINYILTGNKVPDTDGAKPCMDLPNEFPDDIDYDWYIRKTNEILEEIAYRPKQAQLKFF